MSCSSFFSSRVKVSRSMERGSFAVAPTERRVKESRWRRNASFVFVNRAKQSSRTNATRIFAVDSTSVLGSGGKIRRSRRERNQNYIARPFLLPPFVIRPLEGTYFILSWDLCNKPERTRNERQEEAQKTAIFNERRREKRVWILLCSRFPILRCTFPKTNRQERAPPKRWRFSRSNDEHRAKTMKKIF